MSSIMFQGTGSNVGKSILVAGLCRVAKRRGISVAPFKPQNMSNNAAVTIDNGEIGRAQAFQCFASGIEPKSEMNPILLKPESNSLTQIIVNGRFYKTIRANEYSQIKKELLTPVLNSFNSLKNKYDLVLVEGAGSPAEINLRNNDIANMGFANAANMPVILIGDIERGGVIAQILGTKVILSKTDSNRVAGFLINKFRGDPALFFDGYNYIVKNTSWSGFGVLPWFEKHNDFPAEDSYEITSSEKPNSLKIVCLCLPRISNYDDLDPLSQEKNVSLIMLKAGEAIPGDARLVIIPGSKSTISDLKFIRTQKWDIDLLAHTNRGNYVLGICAGYQMLGNVIDNSKGQEGNPSIVNGLNMLEINTVLTLEKTLNRVNANDYKTGINFDGYEIHIGKTNGNDCKNPFAIINNKFEGAVSKDGLIMGSYLHGMFVNNKFRSMFLKKLGFQTSNLNYSSKVDQSLNEFADLIEDHINVSEIFDRAS